MTRKGLGVGFLSNSISPPVSELLSASLHSLVSVFWGDNPELHCMCFTGTDYVLISQMKRQQPREVKWLLTVVKTRTQLSWLQLWFSFHSPATVVLRREYAPEPRGRQIKIQIAGSYSQSFWFNRSRVGPQSSIPNKFLGHPDAAGPWNDTFGTTALYYI